MDCLQTAPAEGAVAARKRKARGDRNLCQRFTIRKGVAADGGQAGRQIDRSKRFAIVEGGASY